MSFPTTKNNLNRIQYSIPAVYSHQKNLSGSATPDEMKFRVVMVGSLFLYGAWWIWKNTGEQTKKA